MNIKRVLFRFYQISFDMSLRFNLNIFCVVFFVAVLLQVKVLLGECSDSNFNLYNLQRIISLLFSLLINKTDINGFAVQSEIVNLFLYSTYMRYSSWQSTPYYFYVYFPFYWQTLKNLLCGFIEYTYQRLYFYNFSL